MPLFQLHAGKCSCSGVAWKGLAASLNKKKRKKEEEKHFLVYKEHVDRQNQHDHMPVIMLKKKKKTRTPSYYTPEQTNPGPGCITVSKPR